MNRLAGKTTEQELTALYIVATPIGNLGDISLRALETLKKVDVILAEDTRHSRKLLSHYGVNTALKSCHEHNESDLVDWAAKQLEEGKNIALISDAGTPLISDPGYVLVSELRRRGFNVAPIPGASSIIAALSVSGLPSDSFFFDGFLPSKSSARQSALSKYVNVSRTVILLESSHRIKACLTDLVDTLGAGREIVLARELTKRFETLLGGSAGEVLQQLSNDANQEKGEFVLLIKGVEAMPTKSLQAEQSLKVLMQELPLKQAAALAAKLTGRRKNEMYELAISLKEQS